MVPAVKPIFGAQGTGMRLTFLVSAIFSILALGGVSAVRPSNKSPTVPASRSLAANEIEDSTKTGAVGPGAAGPRVVRAQILLDRARFSPGEIDGVYGDDFGVAVKGYQENHGLKPTGTIDDGDVAPARSRRRPSSVDLHDYPSGRERPVPANS